MEDRRIDKHPVWRAEIAQQTWDNGETAAATVNCPFNGVMNAFSTTVSNTTGNITVTVTINDSDSRQLYSLAAIGDNGTTVTKLTADTQVCVPDGCSIVVTPSGDPGASGATVDLVFYGT